MGVEMEITILTVVDAAELIRTKSLSPVELTNAFLRRIETLDQHLNSYLTVTADKALREARKAETEIALGTYRGPWHGIPIAVKDLFDTRGVRTTAGSEIFSERVPHRDARVVELLRDAGAILLGKLNLHEWALGVTTNNPHFGPTRNPWDAARIPGGSSGGSSAALAASLCLASLGSDTGGSIRIPSSLCGVVGLKPTYGRVSLRGTIPLSWSLDHVGPMVKSVRDAALMLQVIAGYDPDDPISMRVPADDYLANLEHGVKGFRIAVPHQYFFQSADTEVAQIVSNALRILGSLGASIEDVELEGLGNPATVYAPIIHSEAAAYHADHLKEHPSGFGSDVLERLRRGQATSGIEYAEARHLGAKWRRRFENLLREYTVLATPTTPIPAPFIEGTEAVLAARTLTQFTSLFNLIGLPAISVPCGFTRTGLPVGLQLVAHPWSEAILLQVAHAYEQATPWHRQTPPI